MNLKLFIANKDPEGKNYQTEVASSKGRIIRPTKCSLDPRPHPLTRDKGLVLFEQFLGVADLAQVS